MRKIYHLLFALIGFTATSAHATNYTVQLSGFSYAPPLVNAVVGDQITIEANFNHPVVEVSENTWNNNQDVMLSGGFGSHNSGDFVFVVTTPGTIYFVCENHVTSHQMKGRIIVSVATEIIDAASVTDLKVYPSIVTDGVFNVTAETDVLKGATLELYSTNGQLMESFLLESESAVLRANVATGTYMAIIKKDNKAILRQRMIFMAE